MNLSIVLTTLTLNVIFVPPAHNSTGQQSYTYSEGVAILVIPYF